MDSLGIYRYPNRHEAGRVLAQSLRQYVNHADVLVLGLPRGGVPVAFEIAQALHAPLDILLVRKLGLPGHEELAMGAVSSVGAPIVNEDVVSAYGVDQATFDAAVMRERRRLEQQQQLYRGERSMPDVAGLIAIVCDDGLATGSTMRAAIAALRQQHAAQIVVAVPVGAPETCAFLRTEADQVICPLTPPGFMAVGMYYDDFAPTRDEEVRELLSRAVHATP